MTNRRTLGTGPEASLQGIREAQADLLDELPGVHLPDLSELRAHGVLGAHLTTTPSPRRVLGTGCAHSQYAAQPTPDRPDGAIIATTAPHRWAGEPVRVLDLTP
ncbi:hypothetical protein [Streptomyces mirabilis]|uniref:hypothetical protein n=1 Tax=Streptomyces mirabilis TaxID=68239 RepID=UPI0036E8D639